MDVRSVMTPDPACCTRSSTLDTVARMMIDNDCGEIPVVDDHESRKPVGVITDRDIAVRAVAMGAVPGQSSAGDYMTSPVITVRPEDSLTACCDVMEQHQIRRVLVVDGDERVCGIVSLADVSRHAAQSATAEVVKEVSEPQCETTR
jgi:CBS domain-containing protein